MVSMFDTLKSASTPMVGNRIEPPLELDLNNESALNEWIGLHLGTAYHWMSTCKSGLNGSVADENFCVRGVSGLRVGSGAALPEIPEANPHLTITAFGLALSHAILKDQLTDLGLKILVPKSDAIKIRRHETIVHSTQQSKIATNHRNLVEAENLVNEKT